MGNRFDEAIRFKNGNIHVRFFPETIEDIKAGGENNIVRLLWAVDAVDTYMIGEEFCLSNYDMGIRLYNCNQDKAYTVSYTEAEKLMEGKTLILKAEKPTGDDMYLWERG